MKKNSYSNILDDLKQQSHEFNLTSLPENNSDEENNSALIQKFWGGFSAKKNQNSSTHRSTTKEKPDKNLIHLTKKNLKAMLHDIQKEVERETELKKKPIYRDSIDQLIVETSQQKNGENPQKNHKKLVLTKEEIKEMFQSYENNIKEKLKSKEESYLEKWIEYYNSMKNYCDKYYQLQNLLWYYYSYQPDVYKKLMDEYYLKSNNNVLKQMGLDKEVAKFQKNFNKFEMIEKYIPAELRDINMTEPRFRISNEYTPDFINKK